MNAVINITTDIITLRAVEFEPGVETIVESQNLFDKCANMPQFEVVPGLEDEAPEIEEPKGDAGEEPEIDEEAAAIAAAEAAADEADEEDEAPAGKGKK